MASGTINVTTNNQYISGTLSWSSTQNIEGNYSDVTATLRLSRTNSGYTTTGSGTWTINISGVSSSVSKSVTLTYNSNTLIHTFTTRVYHNADGTKSTTISCSGGIPSTSYTSTSGSGTANLGTIPRASVPTLSVSSVNMGTNSVIVYMNRVSTAFTHYVYCVFGGATTEISGGVVDNVTWTPPLSLASQIPNSTSGYGTIYVDTYNGSTYIGTKTIGITLTVPSTVKPTIATLTATDLSSDVGTIVGTGKFVKSRSNLQFNIGGITKAYGSPITSYKISVNQKDYTGNVATDSTTASTSTGILTYSGTHTVNAWVVDGRGRWSDAKTLSITIMDYSPPSISSFTVERCLSDGTLSDLGTYVKIVRSGTATSLMNTTEKNTVSCTVRYTIRPSSEVVIPSACTVNATSNLTTSITNTPIIISGFPIDKAFDFQFYLVDKFNTTVSTVVVPVGKTIMSWSDQGVGIGKIWGRGSLDVLGNAYIDGSLMDGYGILYQKKYDGTITDFNTTLTQGEYMFAGVNIVNSPNGAGASEIYGKVVVVVSDGGTHNNWDNWIWQTAYVTWDAIYTRFKVNNSAWSGWRRIVTEQGGALTVSGKFIAEDIYASVELGSKTQVGTPYIDFHTSGTDIDFDSRIIAESWGFAFQGKNAIVCGSVNGTNNGQVYSADSYATGSSYMNFKYMGVSVGNVGKVQSDGGANMVVSADTGSVGFWVNSKMIWFTDGGASFRVATANDNTVNLGITTCRWKQLFAGTTTISTSDRNYKTCIEDISNEVLDAWSEVKYQQFKFKDAVAEKGVENARYHIGVIAQEIEEVFLRHGLDAFQYGLLCYDAWEDIYEDVFESIEVLDEDGNVVTDEKGNTVFEDVLKERILIKPKGGMYSVRADECQFLEMALQRRETKRLQDKIAQLEALLV